MSAKEERIINDLVSTIKSSDERTTKPYDTSAIVRRVDTEKGIAYVHIPGGVDETPVKLTINAKDGDEVQVRVANGSAFLLGNASAPPTDDSTAKRAETDALRANMAANNAESSAKVAADAASKAVADVTELEGNVSALSERVTDAESEITTVEGNITNLQGRVTDAEEDIDDTLAGLALAQNIVGTLAWITAHSTVTSDTTPQPGTTYYIKNQDGTFTIVTDPTGKNPHEEGWYVLDESIQNYVGTHLALTNDGLIVAGDNSDWKVLVAPDGVYVLDPQDNKASKFKNYAQLGYDTAAHSIIDADGQRFYASNGTTLLANIGYGEGAAASGQELAPYFTFGIRDGNVGNLSLVEGLDNIASGYLSHAEGESTTASGAESHAEGGAISRGQGSGLGSTASGLCSHAEGMSTTASSACSHAEGTNTTASGNSSHAEGRGRSTAASVKTIIASGQGSHAEGFADFENRTAAIKASGMGAHAEGITDSYNDTLASGRGAHAEGVSTTASGNFSHAQGDNTIASKESQTAIGTWNVEDTESTFDKQKLFIVGNGGGHYTRSNAFSIDRKGNTVASGTITDGTGNVLSDKADKTSIPEIDKGRTGSISVNANNSKDVTVTFDTAFSAVPKVVVSIYSTATAGAIGSLTASALDVTTTGFKVRVFNAGSASRSPAVDWIAIN